MPALYPVSCSPQAWAAASGFLLLQSMLGLRVDAHQRRVWLRPRLLERIGDVRVRNLRVGPHRLDFQVTQQNGHPSVTVQRAGPLEVIVETEAKPRLPRL